MHRNAAAIAIAALQGDACGTRRVAHNLVLHQAGPQRTVVASAPLRDEVGLGKHVLLPVRPLDHHGVPIRARVADNVHVSVVPMLIGVIAAEGQPVRREDEGGAGGRRFRGSAGGGGREAVEMGWVQSRRGCASVGRKGEGEGEGGI